MIKTKYGMIIGTCEWRRKEFIRMWSVVMRDHAWCGDVLYLVGPWTIGLCTTHNNQSDHCTTVEDPSSETEEINQRINGAIENHSSGNNWLLADTICQSLEINGLRMDKYFVVREKDAYVENEPRSGCQTTDMHIRQNIEQMSFATCCKAQSSSGE